MITYLKLMIEMKADTGIYCSLHEASVPDINQDYVYTPVGLLHFQNTDNFYAFRDCLERGRGTRTIVEVVDKDLQERIDWEIANRSQS